MQETRDVDVVVIGAGFAGLRALHTLRGLGMSVAVLEAGDGIGGVWYWNRYPGARCDVESYDYSYAFSEELEQEWRWSERYATQPEILRYIEHVADRFDLRRDVHLRQRMTRAEYDEGRRALARHHRGDRLVGSLSVMAVGNLSTTKEPTLPGQDGFRGRILHTARWPHDGVDFTGKRVGVIGTGSSGMQMIPVIAPEAEHLTVFQRTPNFSIPAGNAPITDEQDAQVKLGYRERRAAAQNSPSGLGFVPNRQSALDATAEERHAIYENAWTRLGFGFLPRLLRPPAEPAGQRHRRRLHPRQDRRTGADPATREKLMPRGFPFGTKRPSVDSGYFPTFNRDNVTLVDIREEPIDAWTHGLHTTPGALRPGRPRVRHGLRRHDRVAAAARDRRAAMGARSPSTGRQVRGPTSGPSSADSRTSSSSPGPGARRCCPTCCSPSSNTSTGSPRFSHMRQRRTRHRRGDRRGRGRLGGARQRARRGDAVPEGPLLLHGRRRAGQASRVHALLRRRPRLPANPRAGRRERLRRFSADPWERHGSAPTGEDGQGTHLIKD